MPGGRSTASVDLSIAETVVAEMMSGDGLCHYLWGTTGMGKTNTVRFVLNRILQTVRRPSQVWMAEGDGLAYQKATLSDLCDTVLALSDATPAFLAIDTAHAIREFDVLPECVRNGEVRLVMATLLRSPRISSTALHTLWHAPPTTEDRRPPSLTAAMDEGANPPDRWWQAYRELGGHPPGGKFSPHSINALFGKRPVPYHRVARSESKRRYPHLPFSLLHALADTSESVLSSQPLAGVSRRRQYYYTNVLPACEVGILARLQRFGSHGPQEAVSNVWFRSVLARNWSGGDSDTGKTAAVAALLAAGERLGGQVQHWMTRREPAGMSPLRVPLVYFGVDEGEQFGVAFAPGENQDDVDASVKAFENEVDPTGVRWPCYVRTPAQIAYAAARYLSTKKLTSGVIGHG